MITHYDKNYARYAVYSLACLAILAILVTSACATLAAPKSPGERIAYIDAAITGIADSTDRLLSQRNITPAQATAALKAINEIDGYVALARGSLSEGLDKNAMDYLIVAERLLLRLQQRDKGGTP